MDPLEELVDAMSLLHTRGLINVRGGNGSVRFGDYFWITPRSVAKHRLEPGMLVKIHVPTGRVEGPGKPSIEHLMHLEIYRRVEEAAAVLHAHSPYTLALHMSGLKVDPSSTVESRYAIGECIGLVEELPPGSSELARRVGEEAERCRAVILAGHGVVAWGRSVYEALDALEALEDLAKISLHVATLGVGEGIGFEGRRRV